MNPQCDERASLLRKALMGNALFSILSGLTILFAQSRVLRILGLSQSVSLLILGIGLLLFAVTLVINARRQQVKISDVWIAVWMDLAWVLGSYVLIFVVPFSAGGKWVVGVVAELVFVFAVLLFVGSRRETQLRPVQKATGLCPPCQYGGQDNARVAGLPQEEKTNYLGTSQRHLSKMEREPTRSQSTTSLQDSWDKALGVKSNSDHATTRS